MNRRHFLLAGAAASTLPLASVARAGHAPASAPRFALVHRGEGASRFVDATLRDGRSTPRVRLALRAIQSATDAAHPLRSFDVELMYRLAGGDLPYAGYRWAWQSRGATVEKARPAAHALDAHQIAALRVTYTWATETGDVTATETLPLTDGITPLLALGDYALVGPDAQGRPARARSLGDVAADRCSIDCAPAHDVLLFSVEALAATTA